MPMRIYNRTECLPKEKGNGYLERVIAGDKVPACRFYSKYLENGNSLMRENHDKRFTIPVGKNGYVGTLGAADFEVKSEKDSEYMLRIIRKMIRGAMEKRPELAGLLAKAEASKRIIYVDAVASAAQKQNVGFDLLERISVIGQARGVGFAYLESTNRIMDRVCEKNGWTNLYTTVTENSFFVKAL